MENNKGNMFGILFLVVMLLAAYIGIQKSKADWAIIWDVRYEAWAKQYGNEKGLTREEFYELYQAGLLLEQGE